MIISKRQTVFELVKLLKNKDSWESWFVWIVKKARFENILYEPQNILKKQEVRPKNLTSTYLGWGGWIRTNECRHQKPMPYHLATPQSIFNRQVSNRLISTCRHIFMLLFLLMQELFFILCKKFYFCLRSCFFFSSLAFKTSKSLSVAILSKMVLTTRSISLFSR